MRKSEGKKYVKRNYKLGKKCRIEEAANVAGLKSILGVATGFESVRGCISLCICPRVYSLYVYAKI